jgi:lipopolysaccharide biosynthesis glycosyltransferase
MKNSLLVTISTQDRLKDAKQLFSGVYFNGGWQGDYMLLAHDIPEAELKWFKDKGILIKHISNLSDKRLQGYNSCVLDKFYLFSAEFKKWDNIVYLDSDILVRASIEVLAKVKGFWAAADGSSNLFYQFLDRPAEKLNELQKKYELERPAFNTGVIAFSTDVIEKENLNKIESLFCRYGDLSRWGEQGIVNLFFYKKWKEIPAIYNLHYKFFTDTLKIQPHKLRGILIHLLDNSVPQNPQDPFYEEWMHNLKQADNIDLKNRIPAKEKWNYWSSRFYFLYLVFNYPRIFRQLFEMMFRNRFYYLYIFLIRCKNKIFPKKAKVAT